MSGSFFVFIMLMVLMRKGRFLGSLRALFVREEEESLTVPERSEDEELPKKPILITKDVKM